MTDKMLELSEERTRTAYVRTMLAEQRTFSAWIRTGLASVATGVAIVTLMEETGPVWLIISLGSVFLIAGGGMFLLAFWGYRGAAKESAYADMRGVPVWLLGCITFGMLTSALIAVFLVLTA